MASKPTTTLTQEGGSPVASRNAIPPSERDRHMAEEGQASCSAGAMPGKTKHVSFRATRDQWEHNKNGK
jgi:hypothetical protein